MSLSIYLGGHSTNDFAITYNLIYTVAYLHCFVHIYEIGNDHKCCIISSSESSLVAFSPYHLHTHLLSTFFNSYFLQYPCRNVNKNYLCHELNSAPRIHGLATYFGALDNFLQAY